jgi:hypothetical protein
MSDSDERKARAFLQDAYSLETESDTLAFYDRWAAEYDAQLERGLRYIAPGLLTNRCGFQEMPGCALRASSAGATAAFHGRSQHARRRR